MMGQGCSRAGELKATFGTGCFMLLNTGEAQAAILGRVCSPRLRRKVNGRADATPWKARSSSPGRRSR